MTAPLTLDDLQKSPERQIVEGCAGLLRADALLSSVFRPIRIIDLPSREAFLSAGVNQMSVQLYAVKDDDKPSERSTILVGVLIAAYIAAEQREEESKLRSGDMKNHLRKLLWGTALMLSGEPITFATTTLRMLPPLQGTNAAATTILGFLATFETDVDPKTGLFSPT